MITAQPESQTDIPEGQDVTFSVTATGESLTYQWQKDGNNILDTPDTYSGINTATLTVHSVDLSDSGQYSVSISNAAGSVKSNLATLSVSACKFVLCTLLLLL